MIPLSKIMDAKARLNGVLAHTKLAYAPKLSALAGFEVFVKQENLQHTGSFKLRGAFNKIAALSQEDRAKGVLAASAGNHAQGVAFAAQHFGIKAAIVMPESTPLLKVMGVRNLGAEAILVGNNYDESFEHAQKLLKERGMVFVPPFADDEVIAGQGTIALEMLEECSDLDAVIVPVGGGGLCAGVGAAFKQMRPQTKIIGVCAKGAPAMANSLKSGKIEKTSSVRTIADGIAVRDVNPLTFGYLQECIDEVICVDDDEIARSILFLLENQKLVAEGAGAAAVAAILSKKIKLNSEDGKQGANLKVGAILSGGNIDVNMLGTIIEKGLLRSHRKMRFCVILIDKPGSLQNLSKILNELKANIIKIDFDRTSAAFGDAKVDVSLETRGKEHKEQIREALKSAGYEFSEDEV